MAETAMPALCSIGQVGDCEWWCSTHKRNAEDCQPTESPLLAAAVRAVMRHFGYTDHQIAAAEDWRHDASDCEGCFDDEGKSLHQPGFDDPFIRPTPCGSASKLWGFGYDDPRDDRR